MDGYAQLLALLAATAIVAFALYYVFTTKIDGFGPYTTSLPILLTALYVTALAIIFNKLGSEHIANILFAAMGYGGGLLTTKVFEARR
jgi:hypothetical protein